MIAISKIIRGQRHGTLLQILHRFYGSRQVDGAEPVVTKDDDDVPNTWIALRIYLSLIISNCSGERTFSKLRRIKNELRSCMTQTRLNSRTLLSVESKILRATLINVFALLKSRRHNPYKASTVSTNGDAFMVLT